MFLFFCSNAVILHYCMVVARCDIPKECTKHGDHEHMKVPKHHYWRSTAHESAQTPLQAPKYHGQVKAQTPWLGPQCHGQTPWLGLQCPSTTACGLPNTTAGAACAQTPQHAKKCPNTMWCFDVAANVVFGQKRPKHHDHSQTP